MLIEDLLRQTGNPTDFANRVPITDQDNRGFFRAGSVSDGNRIRRLRFRL
jgi:hypothetical protein